MEENGEGITMASDPEKNINVNAILAPKRPPPERPESIRVRSLVIASFWAVVLFAGFPLWWWTTSIHRAGLPLREMLDWADGKVCFLSANPLAEVLTN